MKIMTIKKKLCLMLVMIMAVTLMISGMPQVFAAEGYTIYGTYTEPGSGGSDLQLYKVGTFSGSSLVRTDEFSDAPVDIPVFTGKEDYADEDAWKDKWLSSAAALAAYIPEGSEPAATAVSDSEGKFSFTGVENGLYLLTGKSQSVWYGETYGVLTPRPMFIMVLNGDAGSGSKPGITVKPLFEPIFHNYTVVKSWSGGDPENRPKSVKVEIYYGDDLEETVTLSDKNHWTYSWEPEPDKTRKKWSCKEVLSDDISQDYRIEMVENSSAEADAKTINITNVYGRPSLEIVKKMKDHVRHGEQTPAYLGFEITGYDKDGKVVFVMPAGLLFDEKKTEQKINVKEIPRGLARLTVREKYSGNYKPDKPVKEAKLTFDESGNGKYTVEFTNKYDNTTYSGGVINRYSKNDLGGYEVKEQIGLITKGQ